MKTRPKRIPLAPKASAFVLDQMSRRTDERSRTALDNHSLFQPDILLPVQYQQSRRNRCLLMPEQKLALAILKDAVACYQKHQSDRTAKGRALFRAAEEWVMNLDENWIFSFENICAVLELNATYMRGGLSRHQARLQLRERKISVYHLPRRPKPVARRRQSSRSHLARTQGRV
jgi:hypothetical protein